VIVVVFSVTAVVLAGVKISWGSNADQQRRLERVQFLAMADGAVAEVISLAHKGTLTLGDRTSTYSGGTITTNVATHPSVARAYLLTIEGEVSGERYSIQRTIGDRKTNPVHYALWVHNDYESDSLLSTQINGSAFFKKKLALLGAWSVSDDLLVRETSSLSGGTTIDGNYLVGVRNQSFHDFAKSSYEDYPTIGNSAGNLTFGGEVGGYYAGRIKSTGALTLNGGTISGKGTVYVDGDLRVNGNYNYANADSRVVFLVRGKVQFGLLATQVVGVFYARNDVEISSLNLNVLRGCIATDNAFKRTLAALTITHDAEMLNPVECAKHRVPGYYP